jgi:hypothetical protein
VVGLYWARKNEAGDYEIRTVTKKGEGYSVTSGILPTEGFEEHYERVSSWSAQKLLLTEVRKD